MAIGDIEITVVGNLVADPELRYTDKGTAVVNFRVASTPRRFDSSTNQWIDGEATFLSCTAWKKLAQNIDESLSKGMQVVVVGKLRQQNYETKEGEKHTSMVVDVDNIGASLQFATVDVQRNQSGSADARWGERDSGFPVQGDNSAQSPQPESAWGVTDQPPF